MVKAKSTKKEETNDLIIFLGAGISKPLGIPDMYEFVDEFEKKIKKEPVKNELLNKIIYINYDCPNPECNYNYQGKKGHPPKICPSCSADINLVDLEELLSRLHRISQMSEDKTYLSLFTLDKTEQETFSKLKELKEELMDFIYERCEGFSRKDAKRVIKKLSAFRDCFGYTGLKIFTTNYDTCVETVYEKEGFITGFEQRGTYPVWNSATFSNLEHKIKIYKLHGSITWYKYEGDLIQTPPLGRKLDHGDTRFESHILYPLTGKEIFESPFSELQFQLQKTLEKCELLIVIGYSFRDDSIKSIFLNAIHENPDLKVILIDPNAYGISRKFEEKIPIVEIPKKIEDIDFTEKELKREFLGKSSADSPQDLQGRSFKLRDLYEYRGAIVLGKLALKRALEEDNFENAAFSAACLSDCYKNMEEKMNEKKYAEKSIEYYEKMPDKGGIPYSNLGLLYTRLGDYEKAKRNYEQALRLFEKQRDLENIKNTQETINNLAKVLKSS